MARMVLLTKRTAGKKLKTTNVLIDLMSPFFLVNNFDNERTLGFFHYAGKVFKIG